MGWIEKARATARERLRQDVADAVRDTDGVMPVMVVPAEPSVPTVDDGVVRGVRVAAAWAWRFLVLCAATWVVLALVARLSLVLIPLVIALFLSALLHTPVAWLRRRGTPKSLAAAVVLVGGLLVVAGTLTVTINAFVNGFGDLSTQVGEGVHRIRGWLVFGPLNLSDQQIDAGIASAKRALSSNKGALTTGALNTAGTVVEFVAGFFVVLFATFFFLRDGAQIWRFLMRLLPPRARMPIWRAGNQSFATLHSYVRANVFVAFVDALGIGIGAAALRLPLALPIGALVFLSSFVPVVGATLSGVVAVLVALVAKGPVSALVMLGVVVGVQQLEGHVLQPLVMGRAVSLHPLAVITALSTGVVLAGLAGGLIAVPLLAVLNTAVRSLVGERAPSGHGPPGTEATKRPASDAGAKPEAGQAFAQPSSVDSDRKTVVIDGETEEVPQP